MQSIKKKYQNLVISKSGQKVRIKFGVAGKFEISKNELAGVLLVKIDSIFSGK